MCRRARVRRTDLQSDLVYAKPLLHRTWPMRIAHRWVFGQYRRSPEVRDATSLDKPLNRVAMSALASQMCLNMWFMPRQYGKGFVRMSYSLRAWANDFGC